MRVQRTERFEKSLEVLTRGDGRAASAACNAEGIIHSLTGGDFSDVYHKLTCHGETRLANAVKFDLGGGYRMVSVRRSDAFLMLFAGSHDDCDRWLERNRGTFFGIDGIPGAAASLPERTATPLPSEQPPLEEPEEEFGCELSPKELRYVFRGLCGG